MANYYRYTIESANGEFSTRDAQFDNDTEARVKLFEWFIRQLDLIGITLFRYTSNDTCGSFYKLDQYYKPEVIFF